MPLDQLVKINSNQAYAIWNIQEGEEAFLRQLQYTESADIAIYDTFRDLERRKERLATRLAYQLLSQAMGIPCTPIEKTVYARPYVAHDNLYISLTHCFPLAGAIISQHVPVGIDIQNLDPRLLKLQDSYLTPAEVADSNQDLEKLCICWCAKEAIYKAYLHDHYFSLSFIELEPFVKASQGTLIGNTVSGHRYLVHYQIQANCVLVWCEEQTNSF